LNPSRQLFHGLHVKKKNDDDDDKEDNDNGN
ncbi:hypothetical protein Tco_1240396, partial [Tanacetum coccineum]